MLGRQQSTCCAFVPSVVARLVCSGRSRPSCPPFVWPSRSTYNAHFPLNSYFNSPPLLPLLSLSPSFNLFFSSVVCRINRFSCFLFANLYSLQKQDTLPTFRKRPSPCTTPVPLKAASSPSPTTWALSQSASLAVRYVLLFQAQRAHALTSNSPKPVSTMALPLSSSLASSPRSATSSATRSTATTRSRTTRSCTLPLTPTTAA